MRIDIRRWTLLGLFLLLGSTAFGAERQFVQLTGWGGGKPEEIVPQAAEVGFDEIIVWNHDSQYLGRLIELGQKHKIGIYSSIHLGDLKDWKKRRPGVNPPLQEMNTEERAALERIRADKTKGKSGYQYGGEPVQRIEVLEASLLCFHNPEVRAFFEEQIRDLLRIPGLRGIAMDYFGYQNYRCCRCPASMKAFEAWHKRRPDVPRDKALDRFSLETLVDFVNTLARYARSAHVTTKVTCHVYPVFLPEPLYGNRLDVDFCGQTAAWYFEPLWSFEKIRAYARVICGEEKEYFARPEGVAMIGVYTRPELFPVKSPERLTKELQAILDGHGDRVQVANRIPPHRDGANHCMPTVATCYGLKMIVGITCRRHFDLKGNCRQRPLHDTLTRDPARACGSAYEAQNSVDQDTGVRSSVTLAVKNR